jgi:hypothetical protein
VNKAQLLWFVACEGVALDQLSGRVTAFNILDTVWVSTFPTQLNRLMCVASYEVNAGEVRVKERTRVISPSDRELRSSVSELVISPQQSMRVHRSMHAMWSLKFEEAGTHRVVLEHSSDGVEWETISSLPLDVVEQAHPILNQHLG